jgi:hypothetical protein
VWIHLLSNRSATLAYASKSALHCHHIAFSPRDFSAVGKCYLPPTLLHLCAVPVAALIFYMVCVLGYCPDLRLLTHPYGSKLGLLELQCFSYSPSIQKSLSSSDCSCSYHTRTILIYDPWQLVEHVGHLGHLN